MSNALNQLLALAGEPGVAEGYAGDCPDCGRSTYKRGHSHLAKSHGWVYRATSYRCMSCYTKVRRRQVARYSEWVGTQEQFRPALSREDLKREAVKLRESGMSIHQIGMRIGRSERVVSKMLQECGVSGGRVRSSVRVCADCGQTMRLGSERDSEDVLKHAKGLCRTCYWLAYRRGWL